MATGDLTNNIRKLQKELKIMKYQESLDLNSLAQGKASALLPVYHYAFTTYSCEIAELIASTDTELYTKTDLRFMEGCYKILRDLFHYKPPITKEQFFNSGFVERKIIMCTDVLKLVQQKNKSLQPPKKASTTTTSSLGPAAAIRPNKTVVTDLAQVRTDSQRTRPRSARGSSQREGIVDSRSSQREGIVDSRSMGVSPRSLTDVHQPQPVGNIQRHVSHPRAISKPSDSYPPTRDADTSSSSESADSDYHIQESPPVHVASVTSPPRVTKEVLPSVGRDVRGFNWAVVTPSAAKMKSAVSYSHDFPTRYPFQLEEEEERENDIETVIAATPAHSIMEPPNGVAVETVKDSNSQPPGPQAVQDGQSTLNETHILKAIEQLTKCFGTLESGLTRSIESLNARMILVENRVSMMESKMEVVLTGSQRKTEQNIPQSINHSAESQQVTFRNTTASVQHQRQNGNVVSEITRPSSDSTQTNKTDNPVDVSGLLNNHTELQHMSTSNQTMGLHGPPSNQTVGLHGPPSNQTLGQSSSLPGPPPQSALYDESTLVMFSPIHHVTTRPRTQEKTPDSTFCSTSHDSRNPRLSSTPARSTAEMDTQLVLGESMNLQSGDVNTQDQVNRIKNLFKSTEILLKH